MKLGMISTFGVKCGLSSYSTYLGNALKKSGVDITGLAEFPFPDDSSKDDSLKADFPLVYCWKRTEFYYDLIKEANKYDIVHFQHQYGFFNNEEGFTKLLNSIKPKKIITMHDIVPPNEEMMKYFDSIFTLTDKIIVHTKPCYDILLRWKNCPKEKVTIIPHGTKLIDVPNKEEARKILGLPLDSHIIISWGFIWESKGIIELVKVFKEVLKTYPDAIFIHAGGIHPIMKNSDYLIKILKTAFKEGLTPNNFKITQWVPEDKVPTYFGASDLIVLNYMRGSVSASGAAHRVLASHRPILKSDDFCLIDVPGYVFNRFDEVGLYRGILKVLGDKTLQKTLVLQEDEQALETSWEEISKQHKKLYEELI